jgi:hypothetical protein
MYTLEDILRVLRRLDVEPDKIIVPEAMRGNLLRQARALVDEENREEEDEEDEPY